MTDDSGPTPRRSASEPVSPDSSIYRDSRHAIYRSPRRSIDDEPTAVHPKVLQAPDADHATVPSPARRPLPPDPDIFRSATTPRSPATPPPQRRHRETFATRLVGVAVPALFVLAAFWVTLSIFLDEGIFTLTSRGIATVAAAVVFATLVWVVVMRGHLREATMRRSVMLTALSAFVPGLGLTGSRRRGPRVLGFAVAGAFVLGVAALAALALSDLGNVTGLAVNPDALQSMRWSLLVVGVVWVALIAGTHVVTRPRTAGAASRAVGAAVVGFLSFAVAAPLALASQYSSDAQKLVETVFAEETEVESDSRPTIDAAKQDPWDDIPRLNVMLLGADGASTRDESLNIRTDTIMLASIDTASGDTTIIQIPRNLQYTPFPEDSEMGEEFPRGFRGEGDRAEWFINALWERVDTGYPHLFEGKTYRGAEALKQGVEGVTGLSVDYFVLLDMDGLQALIDAMGGVVVNINQRLPIGGDTSGRPPTGWLEPGPNQHLGGYEALWYARSRSTTSDYDRMARQSCLVDAIIEQANPSTMLRSFEGIAAASANMVLTDIPQHVLRPIVDLSLRVQAANVTRVVFTPGVNGYDYNNPDFETMRQSVEDGLRTTSGEQPQETATPEQTQTPTSSPSPTQSPEEGLPSASASPTVTDGAQVVSDACAYNPEPE